MDDPGSALRPLLTAMGRKARAASHELASAQPRQRSLALQNAAGAVRRRASRIAAANADDLEAASSLSAPLRDRLELDPRRIEGLASALEAIAEVPDPVGAELERWRRPNGLDIRKVAVPIGVLAMIYEARPGVTAEAAGLCIRSANAVLLKPGRECLKTSLEIGAALAEGLAAADLPAAAVQVVPSPEREAVALLLEGLDGAIDLLVPRGGRALVERVEREAKIPVLGHREGLNHTYVHRAADPMSATSIVLNAKMRRTSVCGATETLLLDAEAERLLPGIAAALQGAGCELRGCERARRLVPQMRPASEEDFRTEHLAPILNVRVVSGLEAAISHIQTYGSGHTEAILTEDDEAAETFLSRVDAAIVLRNASTQFADGGEFGFGGEIGIATGRLHARGPVGARQLMIFKYVVRGSGQTRP